MFVPDRIIMTFDKFKSHERNIIESNLQSEKLNFPEESKLAMYYFQEKKKAHASKFHSFFKMMPNSFDNFPIFFTESDKDLLKGTGMVEMIDREI